MSDVSEALDAIRAGGIAIVVDDEDRENEGDLVMAAGAARQDKIGFFLQHTSGVLCAPMSEWRADDLRLPPMVPTNDEAFGTAFTVTVDAADDVTTGISAADRALTLRRLADVAHCGASAFVRPGHVFPLRSREGGVLRRPGHTEATTDLLRLAGLPPVGVLAEITSLDKTRMADRLDIARLARDFGLPRISVHDVIVHRLLREKTVEHVGSGRVGGARGRVETHTWHSRIDGAHHNAFVVGEAAIGAPTLVRVQPACAWEGTFGFSFCACRDDAETARETIRRVGTGIVVELGTPSGHRSECGVLDATQTAAVAAMLTELGVRRVRLLVGPDEPTLALPEFGVEVVGRDTEARTQRSWELLGCSIGDGGEVA